MVNHSKSRQSHVLSAKMAAYHKTSPHTCFYFYLFIHFSSVFYFFLFFFAATVHHHYPHYQDHGENIMLSAELHVTSNNLLT